MNSGLTMPTPPRLPNRRHSPANPLHLCAKLYRDEHGAVLAVTMLCMLLLFLMSMAVYAIGETIRQRIELQNAADAAAYSGAVAQADVLSRIAVINQAMAWLYVTLNKMQMDYIVHFWLEAVCRQYLEDKDNLKEWAEASDCGNKTDWYISLIELNRHSEPERLVTVEQIMGAMDRAIAQSAKWAELMGKDPKGKLHDIIQSAMNKEQQRLINDIPNLIKYQVKETLKKNIKETFNDRVAGGANISYVLLQDGGDHGAVSYLKPFVHDEDWFLKYGGYWGGAGKTFGPGTGKWWVKRSGLQRWYKQQDDCLVARWYRHSIKYEEKAGVCIPIPCLAPTNDTWIDITGEMGLEQHKYKEIFRQTAQPIPHRLDPSFFGRRGTIVVGVARRMNNPLFYFFGRRGEEGMYRAFTVNNDQRFMWTASAARAAYNPYWGNSENLNPANTGKYDPTYWPRWRPANRDSDEYLKGNAAHPTNEYEIKFQNLCNSDWDATLLPLHRAWSWAQTGQFYQVTGGKVLEEVANSTWQPLFDGAAASLAVQGAPQGMSAGPASGKPNEQTWSAPDWAAISRKKLILH